MTKGFNTRPRLSLIATAVALGAAALTLPALSGADDGKSGDGSSSGSSAAGGYRFLSNDTQGKTLTETYRRNYDEAGIPLNLDQNRVAVDPALLALIASNLPEGKDLRKQGRNLIAAEDAAVVHLVQASDVWVTFLHEGTNNKNSFGYFTYEDGKPPKTPAEVQHVVVLPNASFYNSGGDVRGMRTGHRIHLGQFPAHTRIGFFVVTDAWDDEKGVDPEADHFYSLTTLNPEPTGDLRKHMVLLRDAGDGRVVLGMEDTRRTSEHCDHDFNDLLFAVDTNPVTAIAPEQIPELTPTSVSDLDGDGVPDTLDDYPDDPTMSTRVTYPSDKGRAQLSFEDMWPQEGDYDLNDLALAYTLDEGRDNQGQVRQITGSFQIKARGAGYSHGFGLNFPNLPANALESASLWVDNQPSVPLVSEPGQSKLTLVLTTDSKALAAKNTNTRTCYTTKFNADKNCPEEAGPTIHFQARLKQSRTRDELGAAPYNPFIYIVGDRPRETHLPDHPPTALARVSAFGTGNEGSVPSLGRYYKTKDRSLPWAVNIPEPWQQPYEKQPIHGCYPSFVNWVNSSGSTATDWFKTGVAGCVFPAQ